MTRPLTLAALVAVVSLAACTAKTEPPCPSGQELCGGFCTDPASYQADAANCGACGISCGLGSCNAGACQCAGWTSCPTSIPRCADTQLDRFNCGACGNVCQRPDESCADGRCQCLQPFSDCVTSCANLQTDPENCNQCGKRCPLTGDLCVAGDCQCPQGDIACPPVNPTKCVNAATDASNCGSCGNACVTGATCSSSKCACPAGETVCGDACVDTETDASNCGACGRACAAGASCAAGTCTCPATKPTACGSNLAGGTCCEGTVCCGGSTCGTKHSNGLGQFFYDCQPLNTYDPTQAQNAARAWQPSGTQLPGETFLCPGCVVMQTPTGTSPASCGTWCYGGPLQGRVFLVPSLVCTCTQNPGTWN